MRLVIDIGNTRIKPAQELAGQLNLGSAIPWRDHSLGDALHAVCAGIPRPTAEIGRAHV